LSSVSSAWIRCSIASNFLTMSSADAVDGADPGGDDPGVVEEGCAAEGCADESCAEEAGDDKGCGCDACVAFGDEDDDGCVACVFRDEDCDGGAPGAAGLTPSCPAGLTPSCASAVPPLVIAVASKSAANLARWPLRWL
jgi:hypothetical protein